MCADTDASNQHLLRQICEGKDVAALNLSLPHKLSLVKAASWWPGTAQLMQLHCMGLLCYMCLNTWQALQPCSTYLVLGLMSLQLRAAVLCAKLVDQLVLQLHRHKLPVLAGPGWPSAKEALIINVVVELFGAEFQPGIEMSGPQRSGPIAGPVISAVGDTFPLLEREASARHLLTALRYIEGRIENAYEAPDCDRQSCNVREGVAFTGQCWMPDSFKAGCRLCRLQWPLGAGHPLSSCSQHGSASCCSKLCVQSGPDLPAGLVGAPGTGKSAALQGLLLLACRMARENPCLLRSNTLEKLEACCQARMHYV